MIKTEQKLCNRFFFYLTKTWKNKGYVWDSSPLKEKKSLKVVPAHWNWTLKNYQVKSEQDMNDFWTTYSSFCLNN